MLNCQHRNAKDLARAMRRLGRIKRLLLTDGMLSHDGSVAPIKEYLAYLPARGLVLLDDAHGAGVLGGAGRGTPEFADVPRDRIIQTMTLSKSFGVYGGAGGGGLRILRASTREKELFRREEHNG